MEVSEMRRRRRGKAATDAAAATEPQSERASDKVQSERERAASHAAAKTAGEGGGGAALVVLACVIVLFVCTVPSIVLSRPQGVRNFTVTDHVLRDAMGALELSNLRFWLMQRVPSVVVGVQAASAMQIAEAQLALLQRGWITEETNYGFRVCADRAATEEPRSATAPVCVHVRLYHPDGSRLVCPCCECTPLNKPGACAKRTCECQVHDGPSQDFLPARPVSLGPLRDVPLQRNLSTWALR